MKTKLLALLGLIVASVSLSLVFGSSPVFAAGEKYKWVNETTIEASGGLYKNVNAAKDGVLQFKHKINNTYEAYSSGDCNITMTISVSTDNKTATLKTKGCDGPAKDFDRSFTISNVKDGPKPDGSDVDYSNVNCSKEYEGGMNVYRCEATKKCVKEKKGTATECLNAFNACMVEAADGGENKVEDYENCQEKVGGGDLTDAEEEEEGEEETACAIDGIGWIICPVLTFVGQITDAAYSFVSLLLEVQPIMTTGSTKEVYEAWSIMRNFANGAFVVAFLFIIFSQVTSVGISNYGIKRMLPRLIIAAILVNISYWICAIAVDISNIAGSSIKAIFDSMGASLTVPKGGAFSGSGGWAALGATIVSGAAVGVALYVGLAALIPAMLAALIAIVTVFLVLTLRQAFIILFVVIAPLAFVAYLLPNTESWFKKWRSLFGQLLAMYVIIAFIFGGAGFASHIVIISSDNMAVQVAGAAMAVIPLFITPVVMKAGGNALNKLGINNINKGPIDRLKRGAEGYAANRKILRQSRALNGVGRQLPGYKKNLQRKMRREAVNAARAGGLNSARTRYIADAAAAEGENGSANQFARQMAGGSRYVEPSAQAQAAVTANALNEQKKAFASDVKDMEALVRVRFDNPGEALQEAMQQGDTTMAVAAQNVMFSAGGSGVASFRKAIESHEAAINTATRNGDVAEVARLQSQLNSVQSGLKTNIDENHGKLAKEKGADVLKWAKSSGGSLSSTGAVSPGDELADIELADQHTSTLAKMETQGLITAPQADRMLNDPRLKTKLDTSKREILQRVANGTPSPVPTPAPAPAPAPSPTPAPNVNPITNSPNNTTTAGALPNTTPNVNPDSNTFRNAPAGGSGGNVNSTNWTPPANPAPTPAPAPAPAPAPTTNPITNSPNNSPAPAGPAAPVPNVNTGGGFRTPPSAGGGANNSNNANWTPPSNINLNGPRNP